MSKEVKRWDELKALAEGMDGWPNKNAFECDDAWCVGAIDEDENLWPVIEIQTEQYDAFDAAEPMAKYYAAANPPAILELLAELADLLAERDALKGQVETLTGWYANSLDVVNEVTAILPGAHYMDPPDGGDVSIPEQVRRMAKDAERYRWLRMADWWNSPLCVIRDPKKQAKPGTDCPSRDRLDAAIDAAMAGGLDE